MTDKKFTEVPEDIDTKIIRRERIEEERSGGVPALHEIWVWRGIRGESLIFETSDVEGYSDEELFCLAGETGILHDRDEAMIRRSTGYVFVNFNCDTSAVENYLEDHGVVGVQVGGDLMI